MEEQSTSSDPVVNIENSCRVCMKSRKKMKQIFSKRTVPSNMSDKIAFCTGIQITPDDGLPHLICNNCSQDLQIAHKFKTTCLDSDKIFHHILKTRIKAEVEPTFINSALDIGEYFDDYQEDDLFLKSLVKVEDGDVDKVEKESSPKKQKDKPINPKRGHRKKPVKVEEFCMECNMAFKTKKSFREHNKTVHKKTSFMCEICGKVFRHQSSQSCHLLTHRDPKFFCHHCEYRTAYRQDLVTHMRIHFGLKKYTCEYCPATFRTSSNRLAHMRRTHQKLQRFTCHLCGRGFYDKFEFQRHLDSHQDVKRYTCDVCDGRFSRRNHWKKHLFRQHNIVVPVEKSGRKREPNLVRLSNNGRVVNG